MFMKKFLGRIGILSAIAAFTGRIPTELEGVANSPRVGRDRPRHKSTAQRMSPQSYARGRGAQRRTQVGEMARRRRQIKRGILTYSNGLHDENGWCANSHGTIFRHT